MNAGDQVKNRQIELSLSQSGIAQVAGVNRGDCRALARDERWPQDKNRAKIEYVLCWAPGSPEQIRDGGGPLLLDIPLGEGTTGTGYRQYRDNLTPEAIQEQIQHAEAVSTRNADTQRIIFGDCSDEDVDLDLLQVSMRVIDAPPAPVRDLVLRDVGRRFLAGRSALSPEDEQRLIRSAYERLDKRDVADTTSRLGEGPFGGSLAGSMGFAVRFAAVTHEMLGEGEAVDEEASR